MSNFKIVLITAVVSGLIFTGCKKEEELLGNVLQTPDPGIRHKVYLY